MINLTEVENMLEGVTEVPWTRKRKAVGIGEHITYSDFIEPLEIQICGSAPEAKTHAEYNKNSWNPDYINKDAAFIAASRTLVPELVKELRFAEQIIWQLKCCSEVECEDYPRNQLHKDMEKFLERVKP